MEQSPRSVTGPAWTVTGLWRPAGVLDRWRLRAAPVVARATVRSDDALAPGTTLVLASADSGVLDVWVRVLACAKDPYSATHQVTLGILGEP